MKIVVTGGAGFVGHHFIEHLLKNTAYKITTLDSLSYSGSMERLRDINAFDGSRVTCLTRNLCDPITGGFADELEGASFIVHMAAMSHVDNSIIDPAGCAHNNVMSTIRILDFIRTISPQTTLINFGTDEVFGPCSPGQEPFNERSVHTPKNPYAASKSAAEQFVTAYINTYGIKAITARSMNIFGERQHVEKFIPKTIRAVQSGKKMLIHASKDGKPGARVWIHARNVADAVLHLMNIWTAGRIATGESFNIVGEREVDNLSMALRVASALGKDLYYELVDFHSSRPGHDLRYGMSGSKLSSLGWTCPVHIDESLARTVLWTADHTRWLKE